MQNRMEEDRIRMAEEHDRVRLFSSDDVKRLDSREKELMAYREHIQQQENQLDEYRVRLKHEQLAREKEIQKELEAREEFFSDREKRLSERQRELEEREMLRRMSADELKMKYEQELISRENELQKTLQDLKTEKERYTEESRKKIERTSKDYISAALDTLEKNETQFHRISKIWSGIGAISLLAGLIFFSYVTVATFFVIPNPVTWAFITFSVFKGLIAVALFAALTKYSFVFSNSYMREALKNADRRHAINFGKFYLESYGAAADWSQIKEAFQHWNITGESSFSKAEEVQLDVATLENAATVIEKLGKLIPSPNKS